MISRRRVLFALGAGVAAPLACLAQQPNKVWRVGFLSSRTRPPSLNGDIYRGFLKRMSELGYVEGRNLLIEWRFAGGEYQRLRGMAAELAELRVDVILAPGPPGISAAKGATATIPIVFISGADPVEAGFVKSLGRPGGNITGLSNLANDMSSKHLEMLLAVVPKPSRVAVLVNPANPAYAAMVRHAQAAAAQSSGMKVLPTEARTPQEIENAFFAMTRQRAEAVIVELDALFIQQALQIANQAVRHRLPSISANREYAEAGGLMSYGQNQVETYRRAADYVDRILKGAKPGDLPVEQPTTLELFINRKTAKALGVTIPQELLLRADGVIE